jgi:transposase-like protein
MVVQIAGKKHWLWRAVDSEGEVLDILVQRRRDRAAAVKLIRKLLKKQGYAPDVMVTDKLRSYGAARAQLGLSARGLSGFPCVAGRLTISPPWLG